MDGPKTLPVVMPEVPSGGIGPYAASYQLFKDDGRPFEGYAWKVEAESGEVANGITDSKGTSALLESEQVVSTHIVKARTRESERIDTAWLAALNKKASV
ncbi:hypothetical protein [Methylovorus sp. MP688]|uniref:hypothetical protein n=1 Tax=Methylovorus sp. (strain MP688) TaxID=887061 RepID=UPI0001EC4507|nr:hypothetical protein [Methylovorus sp. MP688]ADQ84002.1 conserved hypothetical protein [Methylovorus sp. MP688]